MCFLPEEKDLEGLGLLQTHLGLAPPGLASQSTGLPRKESLCPLGLPCPDWGCCEGGERVVISPRPLFWSLCWLGTLRRENSLTVRSQAAGSPGKAGPGALSCCSWKEGLGFSEQGWGRQPAFRAVRELALRASGADSFLSRAGGPRDCSPLSGLGGERPKGRESRREAQALSGLAEGVGSRTPNPFFAK